MSTYGSGLYGAGLYGYGGTGSTYFDPYRDDFASGVLDAARWPYSGYGPFPGGVQVGPAVVDGRLDIHLQSDAGFLTLRPYTASWNFEDASGPFYRFTEPGDHIQFELDTSAVTYGHLGITTSGFTTPGDYPGFGFAVNFTPTGQTLRLWWDGADDASGETEIAYVPADHAHLRARFDGVLIFEASSDGSTWTELLRSTAPFTLDDATIEIYASGPITLDEYGVPVPGPDTFDSHFYLDNLNINIDPPSRGPLVPVDPYTPLPLAAHLLGIGPWNSTVEWRGAPNRGISRGVRASAPVLNLPVAESLSVTLRLGEAAEAKSSHYFARTEAVIIEEMITDLWWRRRDPRRHVVDAIGRFNATTVDLEIAESGAGLDASVTWTDYQGWLEDRLILRYLHPELDPPMTQWNTGTYLTDVLLWALPINMGLDLTGIQAASRDITAKLKSPFELPLGTPIKEMMTNLLTVSDVPWEWWVEMPVSDLDRPRLRLAGQRGTDRGVTLFDIGGHGPIESWSVQQSGDKYANALYFMGKDGGVVFQYDDQIAEVGQRDGSDKDDTVPGTKDGSGQPYLLNAAAQTRLAKLAAPQPSYQLVLRHGFWEGRTHIDVGDWVGVHLQLGREVISGKYRVSEVQIDIDGNGLEKVTVTLGTRRPSRDPRSRTGSTARLVRYLREFVSHD